MVSSTSPPTRNMSNVNANHTWTPQGINVSMNVSKTCYHGFAIHCLLLILLNNFVALQGTKVLEDREIRFSLHLITDNAPQERTFESVYKYTGRRSAPEWMDVERGNGFGFHDFVKGAQIKQTSSRHCAIFRQTSLLPRIRHCGEEQGIHTTRGNLM